MSNSADGIDLPTVIAPRRLADEGVSLWLHRSDAALCGPGGLARLVRQVRVRGAVHDPAVLARAVADGSAGHTSLTRRARGYAALDDAVLRLVADDARPSCDALLGVHASLHGRDGWVSVALDPVLLDDAPSAARRANDLVRLVGRPNVIVRMPACPAGLATARACLAQGIGVHIEAVSSARAYEKVLRTCMEGLELAREAGLPLSSITSVASMDVMEIAAEVDRRLDRRGPGDVRRWGREAAVAQARLAFRVHDEQHGSDRWSALCDAGARPQRLMWTLTPRPTAPGSPLPYVERLVGWNTVVALTALDLAALRHCTLRGDTLLGAHRSARQVMAGLDRLGLSYEETAREPTAAHRERLIRSWDQLRAAVAARLTPAVGRPGRGASLP